MSSLRNAIKIRPEQPKDIPAISTLITTAYSSNTHLNYLALVPVISQLRSENALIQSLVATQSSNEDEVIGHIAASQVFINGRNENWYGLGPVSVKTELQGQGIGSILVTNLLLALREAGASGCVVAGRPKFYRRFGFERDPNIVFKGAPASAFLALSMAGPAVLGEITYHEAWKAV